MNERVWMRDAALIVERLSLVLPSSARIALVREPVRQVQIVDVDLAVVLRAIPSDAGWVVSTWVSEHGLDAATTELALEVLATQPEALVERSSLSPADVLAAHSSTEIKPAALWSSFRRLMERARLTFDTSSLRARVPALTIDQSYVGLGKVQINGHWEGFPYEFRVQYGSAALKVMGSSDSSEPLWFAGMYFDKWDTRDEVDGLPTWDQIQSLFVVLAARIERAPFVYLFRRVSPSGDETPWESSGQSAEDAFENLLARVSRLKEQGYMAGHDSGAFYPEPLNRDRRRFPDVPPAFEVRP